MGERQVVAVNRRARHDYQIEEVYEAGIALSGTEAKSLRAGKASLQDSFARIEKGEAFLYNLHISPYEQGNRYNHDPLRTRRLLLRREELRKLQAQCREKGLTLVPLSLYFNPKGWAKVELALARGKKLYDKREAIAKREEARRLAQVTKARTR